MKKDIGLKVATKREAVFIEIKNACKERIENLGKQLMVEHEILQLAERIIEEENAL